MFLKPADIRVAAQEPEQFVDDRFEMDFLGGEQRETVSQIEPGLRAEDGTRAGAGAVSLELAVFQHMPQQIEILDHARKND